MVQVIIKLFHYVSSVVGTSPVMLFFTAQPSQAASCTKMTFLLSLVGNVYIARHYGHPFCN